MNDNLLLLVVWQAFVDVLGERTFAGEAAIAQLSIDLASWISARVRRWVDARRGRLEAARLDRDAFVDDALSAVRARMYLKLKRCRDKLAGFLKLVVAQGCHDTLIELRPPPEEVGSEDLGDTPAPAGPSDADSRYYEAVWVAVEQEYEETSQNVAIETRLAVQLDRLGVPVADVPWVRTVLAESEPPANRLKKLSQCATHGRLRIAVASLVSCDPDQYCHVILDAAERESHHRLVPFARHSDRAEMVNRLRETAPETYCAAQRDLLGTTRQQLRTALKISGRTLRLRLARGRARIRQTYAIGHSRRG